MKVRAREKSTSETNPSTSFNLVQVSNSCKFQWNLLRRDVFAAPNLRKRHQNELHLHIRHQTAAVSSTLCRAGLSGTDVMEGKACPTQDEAGEIKELELSFSLVLDIWKTSRRVSLLLPNQRDRKFQGQGIAFLHQPRREQGQIPARLRWQWWHVTLKRYWNAKAPTVPPELQHVQSGDLMLVPPIRKPSSERNFTKSKKYSKKHIQLFKKRKSSWKAFLQCN